MKTSIAIAFLASMSAACSFMARDTETYKNDTRTVLEAKNSAVVGCYDTALAANPSQSGNVVVTFVVEKKTGAITNVSADPNQSTAPEALQQCVVTALEGLTLDPADQREGQATFTWTFTAPAGAGKPAA
ncbi:MAG: AgmX/PglI C-terminal domain-containing protein [Myxococcales bacterium]|nr:AgmX/PglI C-terminal domain-containing protein [Myxococcales bacterium]